MFSTTRNKKQLQQSEINNLYSQIAGLHRDLKNTKDELTKEKEKQRRISHLIDYSRSKGSELIIESTPKGIEILTLLSSEKSNSKHLKIEIELFDLIATHYNQRRAMVLFTENFGDKDAVVIADIQGENGRREGHGTVAVNHLIRLARELEYARIVGQISQVDFDHIDHLYAFYEKMGFTVDRQTNEIERIL
ncbi:MAG: hypothetical protein ACFB0B_08640 [Thermonemataceae bacterium]